MCCSCLDHEQNLTDLEAFPTFSWGHTTPEITDSTWELQKPMAHPCPHVPCGCGSQKGKCHMHHTYGAVDPRDRGWIAQSCSVLCSSGNKRARFQWLAAKGCLWAHLPPPVSSPSLSRAPPGALPKCYTALHLSGPFPV